MIVDKNLVFCEDMSLIASGSGTAYGTDTLDLGDEVHLGVGMPLWVIVQMEKGLAGGNVTVQLRTGSGVNGSGRINAGAVTYAQSGAISPADMAAGDRFCFAVNLYPDKLKRYVEVGFQRSAAITAGEVTAFLSNQLPAWAPQADATN